MNVNELNIEANKLRIDTLKMIHEAKTGHYGASFSIIELITYIYNKIIILDENNCNSTNRDIFVLSKGHGAPAIYSLLINKNIIDRTQKLRQLGSALQGHPDSIKCSGIDVSTGSLGQGLSNAVGISYGQKLLNNDHKTYVIVGDGEIQEGICYEALNFAALHKLNNLVVIIDYNKFQLSGKTDEVFNAKYMHLFLQAQDMYVQEIDGHNFIEIDYAFNNLSNEKANIIIANTVKSKGISFMEGSHEFHGKVTTEKQFKQAISELEANYESN